MKIFVTGVSGQLGFDVVKQAQMQGFEVFGTSSKELDITNEQAVIDILEKVKPDVIIHCAAYTAVDNAEDERAICYEVNVNGTEHLVKAAKDLNAKFIYISTDYVFDGQGDSPFNEDDITNPIGYYGETKLQGEQIIQQLLTNYFIVRISWVFGVNGHNFVKTMLRLAESRDMLNVVGDQVGSPTYTADLAELLLDMAKSEQYGIYHASNEGYCSWAEFASEILKQANKTTIVKEITTDQYPTKATRPANSRLDKTKLKSTFYALPEWQQALATYLKELEKKND